MPKQAEKTKAKESKDKDTKPKDSKPTTTAVKEAPKDSKIAKDSKESKTAKDATKSLKDRKDSGPSAEQKKDRKDSGAAPANGWVNVEKKEKRSPAAQTSSRSSHTDRPEAGTGVRNERGASGGPSAGASSGAAGAGAGAAGTGAGAGAGASAPTAAKPGSSSPAAVPVSPPLNSSAPPVSLGAPGEGNPAKVAVQVDGSLASTELMGFLSKFGNVKGTKDCIKEGGTFVFFSDITPPNLERLLGKHMIQGRRAIVFPQDKYKTLVCKNWENFGQCPRGDLCDFAHGGAELRVGPNGGKPPATGTTPPVSGAAKPEASGQGLQRTKSNSGDEGTQTAAGKPAVDTTAKHSTAKPSLEKEHFSQTPTVKPAAPAKQAASGPPSAAPVIAKKEDVNPVEDDFLAKFGLAGPAVSNGDKKKPPPAKRSASDKPEPRVVPVDSSVQPPDVSSPQEKKVFSLFFY